MRFLAIDGGSTFQSCYDDTQEREVVTLRIIDAVCDAVGATDVFAETDGFTLRAGEVVEKRKDVADALKAKLTAGLAQRVLSTVETVELSESGIDARRRELEALLRETQLAALKELPLRAPKSNAAADCWEARFAAKNVTLGKLPKKKKSGPGKHWSHWMEQIARAALTKFNSDHADLDTARDAARDAAKTRKRDLARGDYSAAVEVLGEMLRRKIDAVGDDPAAVKAWLTKTAKRAASKYSVNRFSTLSAAEHAEFARAGGLAAMATLRRLDLGRVTENRGTARDNADDPSRELREDLDRLTSHTRLVCLRGRRAPPPDAATDEPPTAPEPAAAAADVAEEDVAPGGAEASAGGASSEA